jgi:hypothetical protein
MDETEVVVYSTSEPKKPSTKYGHSDLDMKFMEAAKGFHWATKMDFQEWVYGVAKSRHRMTEKTLLRLERSGRLHSVQFGGRRSPKIYALPRKTRDFDLSLKHHEQMCTKTLIKAYRSNIHCEALGEQLFHGCGVLPDWAIRYPNGSLLCTEVSSKDNVQEHRVIPSKLDAYRNSFERIEARFSAEPIVLFILDVSREWVERLVEKWFAEDTGEPFMFIDLETFRKEPLSSPVYFWTDGKEYPLSD